MIIMYLKKDIPKAEDELAIEFIEKILGKNASYTISANNNLVLQIIIHQDMTIEQQQKMKEYFSDLHETEKSKRTGN